MYNQHFGIDESPFSIAPDPRYLYMSEGHREAFAHLLYGIQNGGGFILLTGEVGTGKTTVCRCLLEQVPEHTQIAIILNPKVTALELLASICDELHIPYDNDLGSIKKFVDLINGYLLANHARGNRTVLIIDEAQNLEPSVLEQIRLLTNLETNTSKLLQIIMLGQPELLDKLNRPDLRQLAQRITARFHLGPLGPDEIPLYIRHRLAIAGLEKNIFPANCTKRLYRLTDGIPRLINIICDRALLGAYVENRDVVSLTILNKAAHEVLGETDPAVTGQRQSPRWALITLGALVAVAATLTAAGYYTGYIDRSPEVIPISEKIIAGADSIETTEQPVSAAAADALPPAVMVSRTADLGRPDPSLVAETTGKSTMAEEMVETPLLEQTFASHPIETENSTAPTPNPSALMSSGNADQTSPVVASEHPKAGMPTSLSPGSSYGAALGNLLKLWSIDPEPFELADDCSRLDIPDLRCLDNKSTIEDLLNLDRPALLIFYGKNNAPYYTTLSHIQDDKATLLFGDNSFTVALNELTGRWYGQSIMLWRPPPGFIKPLTIGDKGMAVDWLQNQLALLEDTPMAAQQKPLYDDLLSQQVKKFQLTNGLVPDGIAGAKTLIKINSLTGINVPTLKNPGSSE